MWINIPPTGYVSLGTVLRPAVRFSDAHVAADGAPAPLTTQTLTGAHTHQDSAADEDAEWVVPVTFANRNSACKLRQEFTLDRLAQRFDVHSDGE